MKAAALNLISIAGGFAPFRLGNRKKPLIVTYHRFSESAGGGATPARAFCDQLDYLQASYRVVSLSFIARHLASGESLPAGLAAITIDDGYRDAYEVAFPILRERKLPAALFGVTGFVDQTCWIWTDILPYLTARTRRQQIETELAGRQVRLELREAASRSNAAQRINSLLKRVPAESRDAEIARLASLLDVELPTLPPAKYAPLTWEHLREMDRNGIEIGSHTVTHPILTNVTCEGLRQELVHSRVRLEAELGRRVNLFCYPNGDWNPAVRDEVARAGYGCAVTSDYGLNDSGADLLALKRIHTEADLAHFVQGTSGFEMVKTRLYRVRGRALERRPNL